MTIEIGTRVIIRKVAGVSKRLHGAEARVVSFETSFDPVVVTVWLEGHDDTDLEETIHIAARCLIPIGRVPARKART